jgi:PAS domain S-box-containing protein
LPGQRQIRDALAASEERFAKAFAASPVALAITRQDTSVILEVNHAYEQLLGYRASEIIGQTPTALRIYANPADRPVLMELLAAHGSVRDYEVDVRTHSGDTRRVSLLAEAITLDGIPCWLTILRDVTAQWQADEALRRSEARFRQLADAMPQLVWTATPDGQVDYYNRRWQEFDGLGPLPDGSWQWEPVLAPEDHLPTVAAWLHAVATGEMYQIEHRVRRADSTLRWYLSRAVPVRDEAGQIVRWYGTATDIHEQKAAEEAAMQARQQLYAVLERISDVFYAVDPEWRITYLNRHALRPRAEPDADLIGQELWTVYPQLLGTVFETEYRRAMAEQTIVHFEAHGVAADVWFEVSVYPAADGLSIYLRDVTARKQAVELLAASEERLRLAHDELEQRVVQRTQALAEANRRIALLQQVAVAANEATRVEDALQMVVDLICAHMDWPLGHVYARTAPGAGSIVPLAVWHLDDPARFRPFYDLTMRTDLNADGGWLRQVFTQGAPAWLDHAAAEPSFERAAVAQACGLHTGFAIPVRVGKETVMVMEFYTLQTGAPDAALLEVMDQVGTQLGRVVERTWAQEALHKNERLLQKVLETIPVGVWIVDRSGAVVQGNPEGWRIWAGNASWLPDAMPLGNAWRLNTGEPIRPGESALARLLRSGETSLDEEIEIECADGSHKMILSSAVPLYDDQGELLGGILLNQDITDRVLAAAELAEVRRRLSESREAERLYLAQELHDVPMQELYAAEFALKDLTEAEAEDHRKALVATVQTRLRQANRMLRELCNELRPPILVGYGLPAALEAHAREFMRSHPDLVIELELTSEPLNLSNQVRLALFRIYQQALNNVVKHAQARQVVVRLAVTGEQLLLEVHDDGQGFVVPERWVELARENHFGIVGSVERAETLGGRYEIVSTPGVGTTVRVIAPLPALLARAAG